MIKTLKDGTAIDLAMIIVVKPLIGKGEYASYDVYMNGSHIPIEIFNSDIERSQFIVDWNNSK